VSCNSCSKNILESALLNHYKGCTGPVQDSKKAKPEASNTEQQNTAESIPDSQPSTFAVPPKKPLAVKKRKLVDSSTFFILINVIR
jgi:hypothetical protein